jgi:hypothetical protein
MGAGHVPMHRLMLESNQRSFHMFFYFIERYSFPLRGIQLV